VLPNRHGFLEVTHPSVVVSTLKAGDDGTAVLRVYEAAGKPTTAVGITFATPVTSAAEVDLMEEAGSPLEVAADTVQFDLRPFEIKTLKLWCEEPAE